MARKELDLASDEGREELFKEEIWCTLADSELAIEMGAQKREAMFAELSAYRQHYKKDIKETMAPECISLWDDFECHHSLLPVLR